MTTLHDYLQCSTELWKSQQLTSVVIWLREAQSLRAAIEDHWPRVPVVVDLARGGDHADGLV